MKQKLQQVTPLASIAAVAGVVIWNLVALAGQLTPAAYGNDGAGHIGMIRFAEHQWRSGHFPIDSWYPYLGLGAPHYLTYQGLPATLTGLLALAVGPLHAFVWTQYLLLAIWPVSVYIGSRLFGLERWPAAGAAALAPMIMSAAGGSYSAATYLWTGYGMWPQLWGMVLLPIAWGLLWRAVTRGEHFGIAIGVAMLTVAMHFMTGYYVALGFLLMPWLARQDLWLKLKRSLVLGVGLLAASAWIILPVFLRRGYATPNEALLGTSNVRSYGAHQILHWLVHGQLLDVNRWPVLTALLGVGMLFCLGKVRRDMASRFLVVAWVAFMLLYFGPATFSSLTHLVPGGNHIYFRRFVAGVDLTSILICGIGATEVAKLLMRIGSRGGRLVTRLRLVPICIAALLALAAYPMVTQMQRYYSETAKWVHNQAVTGTAGQRDVTELVAKSRTLGPGRIDPGTSQTSWGNAMTMGVIPVNSYTPSLLLDQVGFGFQTESLMANPEQYFNAANLANYRLFGVRYLIVPKGMASPLKAAKKIETRGPYALWMVPGVTYASVIETTGTIAETKDNIGDSTAAYLDSSQLSAGDYLSVGFDGHRAAPPTSTPSAVKHLGAAGRVTHEWANLAEGRAAVSVAMKRRGIVMLSVSADPGWTATVDGRPVKTIMVAPALLGVEVGPGKHTVRFVWHTFAYYPELLLLSGLVLIVPWVLARRRRRQLDRAVHRILSMAMHPAMLIDDLLEEANRLVAKG